MNPMPVAFVNNRCFLSICILILVLYDVSFADNIEIYETDDSEPCENNAVHVWENLALCCWLSGVETHFISFVYYL